MATIRFENRRVTLEKARWNADDRELFKSASPEDQKALKDNYSRKVNIVVQDQLGLLEQAKKQFSVDAYTAMLEGVIIAFAPTLRERIEREDLNDGEIVTIDLATFKKLSRSTAVPTPEKAIKDFSKLSPEQQARALEMMKAMMEA